MKITVEKGFASGCVKAPPSKSIAHRALISAALSDGSKVSNVEYSDDINATLNCLELMGAKITRNKDSVFAGGLNAFNIENNITLDCFESGSTLRFIVPLCLLNGRRVNLKGTRRLFERPLNIYEDICKKQSLLFERREGGLTLCGRLSPGDYSVPGNISSQFISGLLFTLPLLGKGSIIRLTETTESISYIFLTLKVISDFGISAEYKDNCLKIPGCQKYLQNDYIVEGDYSNAAFIDALNVIGGNVTVTGLNKDSLQGDSVYKKMFSELKMGKRSFDLSDCPDLAPVMFALAAVFGKTEFSGTARLKIKESDRAAAMKEELLKFGVTTQIFENRVVVNGGKILPPNQPLCSHNDHRIVMALAILSTLTGGTIENAEAINKSFPGFFDVLEAVGIGIIKNET